MVGAWIHFGLRGVWCQDILSKTWVSYRLAEIRDERQLSREVIASYFAVTVLPPTVKLP